MTLAFSYWFQTSTTSRTDGADENFEELHLGAEDSFDGSAAAGKLRQHLGICPQYDVLFPDLNALEHAYLFAALRQGNAVQATQHRKSSMAGTYAEVKSILKQAGLPSGDENKPVKELSGGNRRKVSWWAGTVNIQDLELFCFS